MSVWAGKQWAEELPKTCPPEDAKAFDNQILLRLLENEAPQPDDFVSWAMKKPKGKPEGVGECEWASCSTVIKHERYENAKYLAKLPKFKRFNYAAHLKVDQESGVAIVKHGGHVDFWMYKSFNPFGSVVLVEPLR